MRNTDLRIEEATVEFFDERLVVPLRLSKGDISEVTYAKATLRAVTRTGQIVQGVGGILLSDLWAFPSAVLTHEQKDVMMRKLCRAVARWLPQDGWGDPLEKGSRLEEMLPALTTQAAETAQNDKERRGFPVQPANEDMPKLAMLNCMAAFDAAIHDAWGHAIGEPVYRHYDATNLNRDLSAYLGEAFAGRYPADYLCAPRETLFVQHVIGVGDSLSISGGESPDTQQTGELPRTLDEWIRRDGVSAFKLKTAGRDPAEDARQILNVYEVACRTLGDNGRTRLSIDPNEGCKDPVFLIEMLEQVERDGPEALAALDYIEQPFPRGASTALSGEQDHAHMERIARWAPLIIDESLDSLAILPHLQEMGWSGLAVKTCKGHTHSLLAYCWAREKGLFVTLQDLTNIGLALVHSANLCAQMDLSVDYFECNQRQYLPHARQQVREEYAPYFAVAEGKIHVPPLTRPGLY